ncbi:hypothetical protein L228DRAFT_60746 [Xylona heveae TC161]|uniref:Methyltransferase type 11 domain-containing protein n=1 Tax=Xylona heveae (strain CBS 132557 / TC161) TaxID=1328760 RepID=A0A165IL02_XYLHT|nr:hypothetical protein L228DRAFT_60746 [Xylona heveae TC161]KZF25050.1 hypothetical protein L228DRAFT_60746 [Xylona heveae TC161]
MRSSKMAALPSDFDSRSKVTRPHPMLRIKTTPNAGMADSAISSSSKPGTQVSVPTASHIAIPNARKPSHEKQIRRVSMLKPAYLSRDSLASTTPVKRETNPIVSSGNASTSAASSRFGLGILKPESRGNAGGVSESDTMDRNAPSKGLRRKPSMVNQAVARTDRRNATPKNLTTSPMYPTRSDSLLRPARTFSPVADITSTSSSEPQPPSTTTETLLSLSPDANATSQPSYFWDLNNTTRFGSPAPPPASSIHALSASPSTRYSDSPGPFSRTSTPTSISSYSPSIIMPLKGSTTRTRASPPRSRPPVTRRKVELMPERDNTLLDPQGLASLRESLTSSSSGSTIKAGDRSDKGKKQHALPPSLSPPPRKSSIKYMKQRSEIPDGEIGNIQNPNGLAKSIPLPRSASLMAGARPSRPSRDGTTQLLDLQQDSPIIQSNLPKLQSSNHHRRSSSSSSLSLSSIFRRDSASVSISDISSSQPKAAPSTTIMSTRANRPINAPTHPPTQKFTSSASNEHQISDRGRSTSTDSSNKPISRFGFFGLRPRTQSDSKVSERPANAIKAPKKGPVAGTGHEGYKKYSMRGRSGSTTSGSGSWTRSTSAESNTSSVVRSTSSRKSSMNSTKDLPLDEFFLERLSPVVITGGGGGSELLERKEPGHLRHSGRSSVADGFGAVSQRSVSDISKQSAVFHEAPTVCRRPSLLSHKAVTPGLVPSQRSMSIDTEPSLISPETPGIPDFTVCGSSTEPRLANGTSPEHGGMAKNHIFSQSPSSPGSSNSNKWPLPREDKNLPSTILFPEGKEGLFLRPLKPSPAPRLRRKWSFFQRAHLSPAERDTDEESMGDARDLASRPIAHYAMFDAVEVDETEDLEDIMHEVEILSDTDGHSESGQKSHWYKSKAASDQDLPASAFPQTPGSSARDPSQLHRPTSEQFRTLQPSLLPKEAPSAGDIGTRPSRLPQIGRIPAVVSKRDRKRTLPAQSFSRPFARANPRPATPAQLKMHRPGSSRKGQSHGEVEGKPTVLPAACSPNKPASSATQSQLALTTSPSPNPLPAPDFFGFPRRKDSEVSYSSSSGASWAATTAVTPLPHEPPTEDEIWGEYDDLIDHVLASNRRRHGKSKSSFQRKRSAQCLLGDETQSAFFSRSKADNTQRKGETSLGPAPDQGAPLDSKRSSPMSFTDLFSGYGERNNSYIDPLNDPSEVSVRSRSSSKSIHSKSGSNGGADTLAKASKHDTEFARKAKDEPMKLEHLANLRFGALMTSRWLSFGRVLFSPAHADLKQNNQDRLLILDGLGNDDWSFYCALTYPNATVYNLSPTTISTSASNAKHGSDLQSPPHNHRQIYHSDIANPFPFPRGFFTAVVIRFPTANSEAAFRHAISEAKRVLRPGGYLEFSGFDIDMMNMGSLARRAVRTLKVRMQAADPNLSLKSASDSIQKMLGRRGFENLNRCLLGVPVAGKVADSRAGSFDSANYSLDDMLRDHSQEGDVGIAKMVAKVGRWWYSRCYETCISRDVDMSGTLFNNRELLKECEEEGTNFKLFICYAQKPLTPRRRTVSL